MLSVAKMHNTSPVFLTLLMLLSTHIHTRTLHYSDGSTEMTTTSLPDAHTKSRPILPRTYKHTAQPYMFYQYLRFDGQQ